MSEDLLHKKTISLAELWEALGRASGDPAARVMVVESYGAVRMVEEVALAEDGVLEIRLRARSPL